MHSSHKLLSLLALVALTLSLAGAANAAVAVAASFDEKVEKAEAIVLGKCVKSEARWDAEKRFILTYSTFQVEKAMKGAAAGELTLVTPGGQVGELRQDTIGIPAFAPGSENVIFVRQTKLGPTVLYFDQGAYDVVREGNERIVRPVATDAVHVDTQRGVAVVPEQSRNLRSFEADVQTSIRKNRVHRMKMIEEQQRAKENSLTDTLKGNSFFVLIALLGVGFATWRFLKR